MMRLRSARFAGSSTSFLSAISSSAHADRDQHLGEQLFLVLLAYGIHRGDQILELDLRIGADCDGVFRAEAALDPGHAGGEPGPIVVLALARHGHCARARRVDRSAARSELATRAADQ